MTVPDHTDKNKVDLEKVRAEVEILRMCKQKKAELKDLEAQARAEVEAAMGDAEHGTLDGKPAIEWPAFKKRQLDQKALKDKHPELVEEFTGLVSARQFKVVDA